MKISLYLFLRKWKHQKVVFSFCIQILFFLLKMKLNANKKLNNFFSSESHEKTENDYRIHHFLLKPNRPKSQEAVKKGAEIS